MRASRGGGAFPGAETWSPYEGQRTKIRTGPCSATRKKEPIRKGNQIKPGFAACQATKKLNRNMFTKANRVAFRWGQVAEGRK